MFYLLTITVGIFSVAWWPTLLPSVYSVAVLVSCLPLLMSYWGRLVFCFMLGTGWGLYSAEQVVSHILPSSYDKQDFLVFGTVEGLVDNSSKASRFTFQVETAERLKFPGQNHPSQNLPLEKLLLSWYVNRIKGQIYQHNIQPGERWQLKVRLKRPRGFSNPSGFDYQGWLVQQGYSATGYVLEAEKINNVNSSWLNVSRHRENLRQSINAAGLLPREAATVLALTIGDRQQLSPWWNDLVRWGIVHLVVISGLHIGMVAGLGFFLGKLCSRFFLIFHSYWGARWLPPLFSITLAGVYSLLAGFSLPTQRALIAVVLVMLAKLYYRRVSAIVLLAWALLLIALSQPLATLNSGFWLSFLAVALLIWWFAPWSFSGRRSKLQRGIQAQFALLVALSIPLLLFTGRVSWLAPVVNLLAVPWMSLVTVPLSLLSTVMFWIDERIALELLQIAGWSVSIIFSVLDRIPDTTGIISSPVAIDGSYLAAAGLAVFSLLLPGGVPYKWLGLIPLGLILIVPAKAPPLKVTVLDVGQGLSVVVQTSNKTLLYDTGPTYSERFSAGSGIIAPYLWKQGHAGVDKLIISHEDGDHFGGYKSLQDIVTIDSILAGPGLLAKQERDGLIFNRCQAGQSWQWDEVSFTLLSPPHKLLTNVTEGNDSSCVLLIKWKQVSVLLPGDIEAHAEYRLLDKTGLDPSIDVLVAPHHGSKTSSTRAFVEKLKPQHVVFSAGYRHHFGHPHTDVVSRYREVGSVLWHTGDQGAVTFTWDDRGKLQVEAQRDKNAYWWQ